MPTRSPTPLSLASAAWLLAAAAAQDYSARDVQLLRRAPEHDRLAVIVAVSDYDDSRTLPRLLFADKDARDLAELLQAQGFRVRLMLLDGSVPGFELRKPRSAGAILDEVEAMCRDADPNDTILFFFSGHGFASSKQVSFLCPPDCRLDDLEGTALAVDKVAARMLGSRAKRAVLIADACRNIPGEKSIANDGKVREFELAQGLGILFSTAPGYRSYEPTGAMANQNGTPIENGVFSHFLLRALRGEADDVYEERRDGFVTFREASYWVGKQMKLFTAIDQKPFLKWDGGADDDIWLTTVPKPAGDATDASGAGTPSGAAAAAPAPAADREPEADAPGLSWATVVRRDVDPGIVTDAACRARIEATGLPWKVRHRGTGIVLLLVPPGEFLMGSPLGEDGKGNDERQHRRVIERPFYLGETEVTQAQWQAVIGDNPSEFQDTSGQGHPVERVSWDSIQPFLQKTDLALPSEAQWEYACRAGTTTPFHTGATLSTAEVNCDGRDPYGGAPPGEFRECTTRVGSLGRNAWGFADMHGNVFEWCADAYREQYPTGGANEAPTTNGSGRVLRGGAWRLGMGHCRAARREATTAELGIETFGFRVARAAPAPAAKPQSSARVPGPSAGPAADGAVGTAAAAPQLAVAELRVRIYHQTNTGAGRQRLDEVVRALERHGFPPVEQRNLLDKGSLSEEDRMRRFVDDEALAEFPFRTRRLVLYPPSARAVIAQLKPWFREQNVEFRERASTSRQRQQEGADADRTIDIVGLPALAAGAPEAAPAAKPTAQLTAAQVRLRIYHGPIAGGSRKKLEQMQARLDTEGFAGHDVIVIGRGGISDREQMQRYVGNDSLFDIAAGKKMHRVVYPRGAGDVVKRLRDLFPDTMFVFEERAEDSKQRQIEGSAVDTIIDWVGVPSRVGG